MFALACEDHRFQLSVTWRRGKPWKGGATETLCPGESKLRATGLLGMLYPRGNLLGGCTGRLEFTPPGVLGVPESTGSQA